MRSLRSAHYCPSLLTVTPTKGPVTRDPKPQFAWGQSVQSQPLREWKLGTYHFTRVPSPKSQVSFHLRSIRAISTVERMEVGTYHFTRIPSPKSHFTGGQSVQSRPCRAWKLGLTTSHGSQVRSPISLEVNLCNVGRREHGSWDLPLHTGPKSEVPFHLRSIRAI